jgi:hypothetical protein
MNPFDMLRRWLMPDPDRDRKDAELSKLDAYSAETLRRVERVIRLRRVDAELEAQRARHR